MDKDIKKEINKEIGCVGYMRKIFPTFVFLILSAIGLNAKVSYPIPDFAFPQTVIERSDTLLDVSLKEGNELMAVRSLMDIVVARNLLTDSESIQYNVSLIDSIGKKLKAPYSQLCTLLQAEILNQEYNSNRSKFDLRSLPMTGEFPQDPMEWSGEMYKDSIYKLVKSATDDLESFKTIKIAEILPLLTDYKESQKIDLTVSEFIAFKGIRLLKNISSERSSTIIPFYPAQEEETISGKSKAEINSLIDRILSDLSGENMVVKALAMEERMTLLPDYETQKYLKQSYSELKGSEGEGLILYELWNSDGRDHTAYYQEIKAWLQKYPEGYAAPQLKYALGQITKENIEVEFPNTVLPGKKIIGKVNVSNLNKGYLLVFRLTKDQYDKYDGFIIKKLSASAKPDYVIELTQSGTVPFQIEKEVELPGLPAGLYAVVPSLSRSLPKDWGKASMNANYSTIRSTEIALLTTCDTNNKETGRVYVVKGENQQPVEGAVVEYYSGSSNVAKGRLITNKDGWVKIPQGYYRILAYKVGSEANYEAGFSYYPTADPKSLQASILTDLAIYRPGDTVNFAVVGWKQEKYSNTLLKETKAIVTLRDANYNKAATDTLILNEEGRAFGKMKIPEGKLLGNYHLSVFYPDSKNSETGMVSIRVEEYKLPTFLVTIQQKDTSDPDIIKFSGLAQTFSGMPVTNSPVEVNVAYTPWRWGFMMLNARYSETTVTDSEGRFEISLPTEALKGTVFETGRYGVTAQVTSGAGETQTSSTLYFYLGKAFEIRPAIADKIEAEGEEITLNVPVYDMAGLPVKKDVEYRITNTDSPQIVLTGKFESPVLSLPTDRVPSGRYRLEFNTDSTQNQTVTETVVWRKEDKKAPYPTPLWVPETQYVYQEGQNSVEISFGAYWKEWILYVLSDDTKVIETKWLAPQDSLYRIDVEIPENSRKLFVSLSGMHDLKTETAQIEIVSQKSLEKMEIETISFRDNISAGETENWTFKFKLGDKSIADVNAFAVMTDKALNTLAPFNWHLYFGKASIYNKFRLNAQRLSTSISYKTFSIIPPYNFNGLYIPSWETYGYPLVFTGRYVAGRLLNSSMARKSMMSDMVKEEAAVTESAADDSVEMAMGMEEETPSGESQQSEGLRPVEMPVAFFKPDLTANEEGVVTLNFTVPNYNTTWQLQLAGYDDSLNSATMSIDAVASKPVMVKTNLPQFLRTGDKAVISATLYNNSEKAIGIGGKFEIINPFTGNVVGTKDYEDEEIEPSGNKVISIEYTVPTDIPVIAVRAYAYGMKNSDGEQGFVPILPSSTPVTESTTFYAHSDDQLIEVKVPQLNKESNVTLKYCDNPLWEVILSLPSLVESTNASSLTVARWLYGSLTAMDILEKHADIAEGLKNILSSEDKGLSESNLQKDAMLKITALEATPWVNDAANETARIRALGGYLDREGAEAMVRQKEKELLQLQKSDGGWSWFEGMNSSPYITSEIINVLGYLHNHQLLNPGLDKMARKAVEYYDSYLMEIKKRYKKLSEVTVMNYLYSRNMLGYPMKKGMKAIEKEALDSISLKWRHWDAGMKAKAALVMLPYKDFKENALTISNSLEQFIEKRMPVNDQYLMLELFEKTGSTAKDRVMETMLLKKETQDWGRDVYITGVVNSLVNLAGEGSVDKGEPEIIIDGKKINLPATQSLTGNFTVNLDPKEVSGKKIVIKRSGGLPAWGGVISQYVAPIRDVKSAKVENLSIEKHLYKEGANGQLKETTEFEEGDKITVVLNVVCGKDMDYVAIVDSGSACLQRDQQLSGINVVDGLFSYKENRASTTSFFIERMPAGKYVISYDCHAERTGDYASGIAEIQCLYSPSQVAHSGGLEIGCKKTGD